MAMTLRLTDKRTRRTSRSVPRQRASRCRKRPGAPWVNSLLRGEHRDRVSSAARACDEPPTPTRCVASANERSGRVPRPRRPLSISPCDCSVIHHRSATSASSDQPQPDLRQRRSATTLTRSVITKAAALLPIDREQPRVVDGNKRLGWLCHGRGSSSLNGFQRTKDLQRRRLRPRHLDRLDQRLPSRTSPPDSRDSSHVAVDADRAAPDRSLFVVKGAFRAAVGARGGARGRASVRA